MEAIEGIKNLSYALDTFYFLITGALVMWMAAGFAMLEAGLVRSKNTAEILTKNIVLFAIAGIMYMLMVATMMPLKYLQQIWKAGTTALIIPVCLTFSFRWYSLQRLCPSFLVR